MRLQSVMGMDREREQRGFWCTWVFRGTGVKKHVRKLQRQLLKRFTVRVVRSQGGTGQWVWRVFDGSLKEPYVAQGVEWKRSDARFMAWAVVYAHLQVSKAGSGVEQK